MTLASDRERLYSLLSALPDVPARKRDARLEKIADDRALEAYYEVGISGAAPITHPLPQLFARMYPLQGPTAKGVWENALWHYYPPLWVDPIAAIVDATLPDGTKVGWWNSQAHKDNLLNTAATSWGIGLYVQPVSSEAPRYYAITEFTEDLIPATPVYPLPTAFTPHFGSWKATVIAGKPRRAYYDLAARNWGNAGTTGMVINVIEEVKGPTVEGSPRWFLYAHYINGWKHCFSPLADLRDRIGF